jgi:hypothetical protein
MRIRDLAVQAWWLISGILYRWPIAGISAIVSRMNEVDSAAFVGEGKMRVKTFYAYNTKVPEEFLYLVWVLALVGTIFGAVHCAGWNSFFRFHIESTLWRISSAMITGIPTAAFIVSMAISIISGLLDVLGFGDAPDHMISEGWYYSVSFFAACYILARITLLAEAFISLRDLQPDALAVVKWTTFIPHV